METPALTKFQQAVTFASENLISEAATAFREVVDRWPDDDLADDALYNVGACYLAMNQFGRAADELSGPCRERHGLGKGVFDGALTVAGRGGGRSRRLIVDLPRDEAVPPARHCLDETRLARIVA